MRLCQRTLAAGLAASMAAWFAPAVAAGQAQSPRPTYEQQAPPPFDAYPLGPDSRPEPGVPQGKTFSFEMNDSKVFPSTTRRITVYIPAEYTEDKPACLYVGLDGLGFNAATVFDNLISQKTMPITIGIGLTPGSVPSAKSPDNLRFDRSFEFDSRSDRLARFLLEEVVPEVEKHTTPDGRPIRISADGNDHAIGGASTGAIGSFTAAWERPDAFSRVFSAIGTYVGMRGGESYYVLVRKTEPKPLRIFMQDGAHDEWMGGPEMGDWWMSNLTMERALTFAGYDVRHVWGAGTHNDSQASSIFPEAMKWLWRDWPARIKPGISQNPVLQAILDPGQDWQLAPQQKPARHIAANARGELLTSDPAPLTSLPGLQVQGVTTRANGDMYVTGLSETQKGEIWLVRRDGTTARLDSGLLQPTGIAFSPDGLWLFVAQAAGRQGISYRVREDGTLDAKAPFYEFYTPTWAEGSGAGDIAMDRDGRAYVATLAGIQVFDRNGRVAAILPLPGNEAVTSVCFGGPDFHTLYAATLGKIYGRHVKAMGAPLRAEPTPLPPGNPG